MLRNTRADGTSPSGNGESRFAGMPSQAIPLYGLLHFGPAPLRPRPCLLR